MCTEHTLWSVANGRSVSSYRPAGRTDGRTDGRHDILTWPAPVLVIAVGTDASGLPRRALATPLVAGSCCRRKSAKETQKMMMMVKMIIMMKMMRVMMMIMKEEEEGGGEQDFEVSVQHQRS